MSRSLTFYTCRSAADTKFNNFSFSTGVNQVVNASIFAEITLKNKIGSIIKNDFFDYGILNLPSYKNTGTTTYFLPEGTITVFNTNTKCVKTPDGTFVLPPLETTLFEIVSGTGDFFKAKGSVFREPLDLKTNTRKITITFDD
jgi:hypothetical protein